MRWTDKELGRLRMIIEREQSQSIYEMARVAQQTLRKRTINGIQHKIRTMIAEREFRENSVEFNGVAFPAEVVSGYIIIVLENGSRIPLHHYVWKQAYGEIPSGYHVHHRDGNSLNNNENNLMLMSAQDHLQLHSKGRPPETFVLFSYLQEKGLWGDYLTYRNNIINKIMEGDTWKT